MAYRSALKAAPNEQTRRCQPSTTSRGPGLRQPQMRSGIPSARTGLPVPKSGIPARSPNPATFASSGIPRSGIPSYPRSGLRPPQARRQGPIAPPEARERETRLPLPPSRPTHRSPVVDTVCPSQSPTRPPPANQFISRLPASAMTTPPPLACPVKKTPVRLYPTPPLSDQESPALSSPVRSYPIRSPAKHSSPQTPISYNTPETPKYNRSFSAQPPSHRVLQMVDDACEMTPPEMGFSQPPATPPRDATPVKLVDLSVDEIQLEAQEQREREELNDALRVVQSVRRSYLQNSPQIQSSPVCQRTGNEHNQLLMRRLEEYGGYVPDLDAEEMPEYMYSDEMEEELNPLHEWARQPYSSPCPQETGDLIDMDTDPWTYSTELYRLVRF